ncbi:LysE family translocator [Pseudomonas sp. HS-18]|uniref:LysE family translocator n=1 Tax=Pseudomonas sp. HS-18 TaxID=2879114 RepID=UPI001CF0AD99|nr:LysE family transporter [Pseudomonas sp. HS-18]UCL85088.1 LysE family translocator [Pseudomonas sp. HS-18]
MLPASALKAFLFGITLSIAVGPIALIIIRNGIQHGRVVAIKSAFGAAIGDLFFSVIAFASASLVVGFLSSHQRFLSAASALILILFGLHMICGEFKAKTDSGVPSKNIGFTATFILTISNPLTILAISAFATQVDGRTIASLVISCLCLFSGSLFIQCLYALGGTTLKPFITNNSHLRILGFFSGLGVTIFGLVEAAFLWK